MKGKHITTLLTCIGAVGVIVTAVLAVKATPKAMQIVEEAKEEKGEELTKVEFVKAVAPAYIPATAAGVATIACIFGANVLDKKQLAALASAGALVNKTYKEYRNKVKEQVGEETEAKIEEAMAKEDFDEDYEPSTPDVQLFYDMSRGVYFESTIEPTRMDDGLECYIIDTTPF